MEQAVRISVGVVRRFGVGPLALLLLGAALVGCGSSRAVRESPAAMASLATQSRAGDEHPYAVPIALQVQPRQLAAFALLRTPVEGLPAATQQVLRRPIFGINWRLAQRIPVKSRGVYWLVPGNGHLCVISQGAMGGRGVGTTCETTAQAIAHGIADIGITLPGPGHRVRLIVGVAPVGTRQALVHTLGETAVIPVHAGVFVLRDSTLAPPDGISLR
jgi:hypothetical protein